MDPISKYDYALGNLVSLRHNNAERFTVLFTYEGGHYGSCNITELVEMFKSYDTVLSVEVDVGGLTKRYFLPAACPGIDIHERRRYTAYNVFDSLKEIKAKGDFMAMGGSIEKKRMKN
ncbi:hypothetical protein E5676_scaffold237G00130 [Cucumis melo var. makuwa]|uniref:Uncharacterized protein n=1 Tax=Cucumis melo var. makuwa TaxID=1194695 RepID=A0A5D3DA43_CUCMM|nr:hypothetical protein E5676_scaffold237G00130 [Cucumis melo var. makuwa]